MVDQLKEVLGTHPGLTEVQLRLLTRSATTVLRLDERLRVTPDAPPSSPTSSSCSGPDV